MSEFFAMGGYAAYVWSSFGVFAAVVVWNVITPRVERTAVLRKLIEDEPQSGDRE
ncbi:heme exporter protein D [Hydrocarboniphaga daqingensis]|uniref:Heme exporter protein D n=1 Tax=Hydrocarboniphaga daqingensis TaxID=490188 RepID=A0A1M5RS73_9GAMM|nr:heme exporter protein CcmD [Hydrocarboniphaga daqingensis]SHH29096.1 heme exporter protein D [Hydrocarboniphaga daqingensis]